MRNRRKTIESLSPEKPNICTLIGGTEYASIFIGQI